MALSHQVEPLVLQTGDLGNHRGVLKRPCPKQEPGGVARKYPNIMGIPSDKTGTFTTLFGSSQHYD